MVGRQMPDQGLGARFIPGQQRPQHPAPPEAAQHTVAVDLPAGRRAHRAAFIGLQALQQVADEPLAADAARGTVPVQQGRQVGGLQRAEMAGLGCICSTGCTEPSCGRLRICGGFCPCSRFCDRCVHGPRHAGCHTFSRRGGFRRGRPRQAAWQQAFCRRLPYAVKLPRPSGGMKAHPFVERQPGLGGLQGHTAFALQGEQLVEHLLAQSASLPGIIDDDHADAAVGLAPEKGKATADQAPVCPQGHGASVPFGPLLKAQQVGLAVRPAQRLAHPPAGVGIGRGERVEGGGGSCHGNSVSVGALWRSPENKKASDVRGHPRVTSLAAGRLAG